MLNRENISKTFHSRLFDVLEQISFVYRYSEVCGQEHTKKVDVCTHLFTSERQRIESMRKTTKHYFHFLWIGVYSCFLVTDFISFFRCVDFDDFFCRLFWHATKKKKHLEKPVQRWNREIVTCDLRARKHILVIFPIFLEFIFFYPLAAEAKLADKAQHFYGQFFCCCGRFVLSCLVLFAFPIKSTNTEVKNGIHNKMFEFFWFWCVRSGSDVVFFCLA